MSDDPAVVFPERLDDGVVELRPVGVGDAEDFAAPFQEDAELWIRLGISRPWTPELVRESVAEEQAGRASGSWARYAIVRKGEDRVLGSVILLDIDTTNRRAELGIWLAPAARGTGLGQRAMALAAQVVFDHLDFDRLWLRTELDNAGMRSLARRAGFTEEGVMREHDLLPDGRRVDIVVAGRLRGD